MDKHLSHILELGKRDAAVRLRELMNELELLISSFPHLRDAFDTDELPVSFIMRRDARLAGSGAIRRQQPPAPATVKKVVSRRMKKGDRRRRRVD